VPKQRGQFDSGGREGGPVPAVAIVVSRYNPEIAGALLDGAVGAYRAAGGDGAHLRIIEAPGAFELPVLAGAAAASGRFGAVVALGCVIRGETRHDEVIAHAVAGGLTRVGLDTGVPVGLGLLTVNDEAQAWARAGGPLGNKGSEAMEAALWAWRSLQGLLPAGASDRGARILPVQAEGALQAGGPGPDGPGRPAGAGGGRV